jgi:hypothetical protein
MTIVITPEAHNLKKKLFDSSQRGVPRRVTYRRRPEPTDSSGEALDPGAATDP